MRLSLDDGYTLDGKTLAEYAGVKNLPIVTFRYRPALPEAIAVRSYEYRMASSGKAELDSTAKLVAAHLVSWDVTDAAGKDAAITVENIRKVPDPILGQLVDAIVTWAAKADIAAGNSPAA